MYKGEGNGHAYNVLTRYEGGPLEALSDSEGKLHSLTERFEDDLSVHGYIVDQAYYSAKAPPASLAEDQLPP